MQRRLQDWRALHRPDQERSIPPGTSAGTGSQFDFTHGDFLRVTIAGQIHPHLLFQLILSRSGWRYAEVATGETFLALLQGLQQEIKAYRARAPAPVPRRQRRPGWLGMG